MDEYYYRYLGRCTDGKLKQQAYHAIKHGLEEILVSFSVPKLSADELSEVFTFVSLDHPEIFYAPSFTYTFFHQADSVEFTPKYLFKKKEIIAHQKAIDSRIKKITVPAKDMDITTKEQYIHDFICKNVHYDKLKKAYSHEIIGPLTQGVGVCEGIAKTVKVLCDELSIPCMIAFCRNNPEKGIKYRHAWNIVNIGGKYYHLDATFDNTLSTGGDIRYDYFNTDDTSLFRDHEPLVWPMPACSDRSEFYYIRKKLSFTKYEDVRNRVSQAAKNSKPLIFHWRGGYLTQNVLGDICNILDEEASKKGKSASLSLNWPQAVLRVSFEPVADIPVSTKVNMEISNQGEVED